LIGIALASYCCHDSHRVYLTLSSARHIRADGLAALTLHANIQPGSRVLVFETCNGLVAAAALNQLGGKFDYFVYFDQLLMTILTILTPCFNRQRAIGVPTRWEHDASVDQRM
jgi:hypothetical protein